MGKHELVDCTDVSRRRRFLLPVEGRRLHRGLTSVPELLLPPRVDLVGVLLEGQERALHFLVGLRKFDDAVRKRHIAIGAPLPLIPGHLSLCARDGALLRSILVTKRTAASRRDHVRMAKIHEKCRKPQRVHATRDDGGRLLHALPLLVVVWTVSLVVLEHESDVLVRGVSLHFTELMVPTWMPLAPWMRDIF